MLRTLLLSVACLVTLAGFSWAAESGKSKSKSIDDELLDDLESDLGEKPSPRPEKKPATPEAAPKPEDPAEPPANPEGKPTKTTPAAEIEGEDIGQEGDPLDRISRNMRTAQERLRQRDSSKSVEIQGQIVADLDRLLAEARKQQNNNSGQQSSSKQQPKPQQGSPKPNKSGESQEPGESPARESTNRLTNKKAETPDMSQVNNLLKEVWGHLPEHVREQMLQTMVERFLPKYELQIEDYFRQLAEDQDDSNP